jgi:hypothetical protein
MRPLKAKKSGKNSLGCQGTFSEDRPPFLANFPRQSAHLKKECSVAIIIIVIISTVFSQENKSIWITRFHTLVLFARLSVFDPFNLHNQLKNQGWAHRQ